MEKKIKTHKDLRSWQLSIDLVTKIYQLTSKLPVAEKYGLISQMKRSSISIASNIAEGSARISTQDYIRFLHYALGSLSELETQLIISKRLGYIESNEEVVNDVIKISNYIRKQIQNLSTKSPNP